MISGNSITVAENLIAIAENHRSMIAGNKIMITGNLDIISGKFPLSRRDTNHDWRQSFIKIAGILITIADDWLDGNQPGKIAVRPNQELRKSGRIIIIIIIPDQGRVGVTKSGGGSS